MCTNIDIEIRKMTSDHGTSFRLVTYDVEVVSGEELDRTVKDIFVVHDFNTTLDLISETLKLEI